MSVLGIMEDISDGLLISDKARRKFSAAVDKQNLIAQTGKLELCTVL